MYQQKHVHPKASLKMKRCPICKVDKDLNEYDHYFSKDRNKYRPQNYCRECSKKEKTRRSADYFRENKQERLDYAKKYRDENKDLILPKKRAFQKKYREELHPIYVIESIRRYTGLDAKVLRSEPELLEAKKASLTLKRKIKSIKNEKQIN